MLGFRSGAGLETSVNTHQIVQGLASRCASIGVQPHHLSTINIEAMIPTTRLSRRKVLIGLRGLHAGASDGRNVYQDESTIHELLEAYTESFKALPRQNKERVGFIWVYRGNIDDECA